MTRTSQRKRAKVYDATGGTQQRTKLVIRRTGGLSQLMNMPMDILMEIFGHLRPLDLLHLARTTKAFRRVLMHRSSLFLWKSTLSTIPELPDCPQDLSEPQWANLVFDPHCHSCLRPNIRTVDWELRVRLCTKCTKTQIAKRADYQTLREDFGTVTRAVPSRPGKRGCSVLFRDEYARVKAQYHAIENLDARRKFLYERAQRLYGIDLHAKLCVAWASAQARVRSDELNRLKSSRYQAIVDKLVNLGWGDEIGKMRGDDALWDHKLVKVPQLLTERIWGNISETIIEYMWKHLGTRRELDAIRLLRAYKIEHAPLTNVMPEPFDFCSLDRIKELLDQPRKVNVESESFLQLKPELHGMVEEWRCMILTKFIHEVRVGVVNRSIMLNDDSLDRHDTSDQSIRQRVQLASTVFACVPCQNDQDFDNNSLASSDLPKTSTVPKAKPLWFPRVLGHHCLTKPQKGGVADDTTKQYVLPCHRQRWSCDSIIKVDQEACAAAVAIIEACGMNPSIATADDMDQLDARVECLVEDTFHLVLDWQSAVKHQRECHPSDPGAWRMLTASEAKVARVEEVNWGAITPKPMVPSDREAWLCLHCVHGPDEQSYPKLENVEWHVEVRHDVEKPQMNHDYFKDFESPELYAPPTLFNGAMVKFPVNAQGFSDQERRH